MKPGFFRQSPAAAHCGQSFSLSRHMLVHTPHETGHVDRIAGFCEHTASKEDERRRCGAGRAGRASSHGSHLDALAIPRPPAALFRLLVVALDLANSARGGTRLEHVPRVRLALPVLCPIGARLLDVTAEQRAVAARMDALLLHKLLVLAIALAVLGPRAARRVVVVAQAPARHTANREQREGEKPHHLSRHRQTPKRFQKFVCPFRKFGRYVHSIQRLPPSGRPLTSDSTISGLPVPTATTPAPDRHPPSTLGAHSRGRNACQGCPRDRHP